VKKLRILLVFGAILALVGAARVTLAADAIINEFNAVDGSKFLANGASDPFWGQRAGNGDDWFEVVVVTDHLDMSGWQFRVVNRAGDPLAEESFLIKLTSAPIWQDLRSGTIITVSEDLKNNVGDYNPAVGSWWFNVRAAPGTSGTYATVECVNPACLPSAANWKVSNNDSQITIEDDLGAVVFGPVGEGIQPLTGVGSSEVFKLEQDPSASVTPTSTYNDGSSSTFGAPNVYAAGTSTQDFSALRIVVPYHPLTDVRINEVLSHSDPGVDWVELYNSSSLPVDVSNWYLSDSFSDLTRYQIPTGTVIDPGDYLVIDQLSLLFAFSSPCGDEVILSEGDGLGPTGGRDFVEFGPIENGVSYGRFPNGDGPFVRIAPPTPGTSNADLVAAPLALSEIMYHPPDPPLGVTVDLEYVELSNPTALPVDLFTDFPGFGVFSWKLTGGIDFVFPSTVTLAGGEKLLVVSFDPVAQPALLAEFQSVYGLDSSTTVLGPYQGGLDNFSDTVRLRRPDTPEVNGDICGGIGNPSPYLPYVAVDELRYVDFAPWPTQADGGGSSLERTDLSALGSSARFWAASGPAGPTPGAENSVASWPTKTQQKCLAAMSKDAAKMAKTSGKDVLSCIKDGSNERLVATDIEACSGADRRGKIAKAGEKTDRDFGKSCSGVASDGFRRYASFGVTDAPTTNAAAETRPRDYLHDVFGPDLDAAVVLRSVDSTGSKCQQTLAKDGLRCVDTILKEFGRCEKLGLALGTILGRPGLDGCAGDDTRGKIAKVCDPVVGKIGKDLVKRCAALDLVAMFPGCATAGPAQAAFCLSSGASCRSCRLLREAKQMGNDCDLFDDGLANGSCM